MLGHTPLTRPCCASHRGQTGSGRMFVPQRLLRDNQELTTTAQKQETQGKGVEASGNVGFGNPVSTPICIPVPTPLSFLQLIREKHTKTQTIIVFGSEAVSYCLLRGFLRGLFNMPLTKHRKQPHSQKLYGVCFCVLCVPP